MLSKSGILTVRLSFVKRISLPLNTGLNWPLIFWPKNISVKPECRNLMTRGNLSSMTKGAPYLEANGMPGKSSIGWPAVGRNGETPITISTHPKMPKALRTS